MTRKRRKYAYGIWTRVVIPETGEERLAWLASHPIDAHVLKESGWRRGDECRAEFRKPRNVQFWRLAHAIGALLVEHVEKFRDCTSHDALKAVQREAGSFCEQQEVDLGPLGKVQVNVARSLAFDEMDEADFRLFFQQVTQYIADHYTSVMLDDVVDEFWRMLG